MKKKTSTINNIIMIVLTVALVLVVALINNSYHGGTNLINAIFFYFLGAIVWGVVNAFVHEFGHVRAGKRNGFKILSVSVWFFKWTKVRKGYKFSFTMLGDEAGYTESIPEGTENLAKRLKKMSLGGIIASGVLTICSAVPLFFCGKLPYQLYCILAISLPVSAYYFFGNALPMISNGVRNDGAVIYGLSRDDDESKVLVSLLSIHAELNAGKTPAEIDEKYYFDLPQLPEDNHKFYMLLDARFNYYVDKGDFENAKKIIERITTLKEEMPSCYLVPCNIDTLYAACTFDFNEEIADNIMYELEKPLNAIDNATNLRSKIAYLLYVKKEKEMLNDFYDLAIKMAAKDNVLGIARYEKKLLDEMKEDF